MCIVWTNSALIYSSLASGLITIVFWFVSQFSDPGFIRKPKQVDFLVSIDTSIFSLIIYYPIIETYATRRSYLIVSRLLSCKDSSFSPL